MKKLNKIVLGLALVVSTIFSSNLYASTVEEKIAGLYVAFFNRAADKSGLEYWKAEAQTLGEAEAMKTLAAAFATHPKFKALYDSLNNQQYVKAIYLNTLGQAGDTEGIAYWTSLLDDGMSRSDMVSEFVLASLDFDSSDPKYDSLRADSIQDSSKNTNVLNVAQQRQDLLKNRVAIALMFSTLLKEATNLEGTTNPLDSDSLDLDPVYRASVAILREVTHDNTSRENIETLLAEIATSPSVAIAMINRLRVQYGSLVQDEETRGTIKSLLEGLEAFTFETITSQTTRRVWMDRNLGASAPCSSVTDEACFGDYYQWGRYPDGHEKASSSISLRVQDTYNPNDGKFVINSSDWTALDAKGAQRELTWNVCPTGFRMPTLEEVQAEDMSKNADFFKLAFTGQRDDDGSMQDSTTLGFLQTTTPTSLGLTKMAKFTATYDTYSISKRTVGAPVRCIQVTEPVAWEVSEWSTCSGTCGRTSGYQSRRATCQDATGTLLNESYCTEAKPTLSQVCTIESPTECSLGEATCSKDVNFSTVGYYDMTLGEGSASQVSSIQNAGLTDVKLFTLDAAELDTVEMMYVQNPSNSDYGAEYPNQLGAIQDAVSNGKTLIIHDRRVTEAASILPNGGSIVFHRLAGDDAEIEIIDDNLETGLGGTIDDDSLDGYGYSNHGYAELSSLPAGAEVLMNNGTSNQIVTFSYPYGNGKVVYSTIPLDAHIGSANMLTYATNLLEDLSSSSHTVDLVFTSSATASVNENQTDAITLAATDGCSLTYSISGGDSASFDVNATTGVVTFKVAPDFETKSSYTFTAKATDVSGNETTQEVTITIDDVFPEVIVHNSITYSEVLSPFTGKTWLDRNLGASQVCTAFNDAACYGDYYQWGRDADGHEDSASGEVTSQVADIANVGHDDFIKSFNDWASVDADGSLRAVNWSKTDGTSVCPVGYRVPTYTELRDETLYASTAVGDNADAYNNFLKLPSAGFRGGSDGLLLNQGSYGIVLSSSFANYVSESLGFFAGAAGTSYSNPSNGASVRCLKD